jgi:hypothetical protein
MKISIRRKQYLLTKSDLARRLCLTVPGRRIAYRPATVDPFLILGLLERINFLSALTALDQKCHFPVTHVNRFLKFIGKALLPVGLKI